MTDLKTIDLDPFYDGNESDRRAVAAEIDRACRELGFFGIVGHRIPLHTVADARAAVRQFFDLPLEAKLAARTNDPHSGRGYVPLGGETLSSTTNFEAPPDRKETFSMGPFDITDDPYYLFEPSGIAFAANIWPPAMPSFEAAMISYYRALAALADDLNDLAGLAFNLPQDWWTTRNNRPTSALRVLHYPPGKVVTPGQFPASPHTDYGTWTILQKRPGLTGLEAQAVDGSWVQVRAPDNGLVVNVGDLLMRWTGGHWLSTLHRVVPTEQTDPAGELSLAFFHQPNWDVVAYPWHSDILTRHELADRYADLAAERYFYGVPVGEFVFGKYRASVTGQP